MKTIIGIALAAAMVGAGATAATVAQNRTPSTANDVAALRAEVAGLRAEVAGLKQTYARHYHYYNAAGGSASSGTSQTSAPAG